MVRYIDADRLKKHYSWWDIGSEEYKRFKETFDEIIDAQPTAQVSRITKCAACRFNQDGKCRLLIERDPEAKDHRIYSDFWCAYGEK